MHLLPARVGSVDDPPEQGCLRRVASQRASFCAEPRYGMWEGNARAGNHPRLVHELVGEERVVRHVVEHAEDTCPCESCGRKTSKSDERKSVLPTFCFQASIKRGPPPAHISIHQ